jgi:hypothetical protein
MLSIIQKIFLGMENLISRGDNYYGRIVHFSNFINVLYIIIFSLFGVHILKNDWLRDINTSVQLLICLLLLFKFNPFREHVLKQSDSTLIFSSAVFLFFNLSIVEYINRYTTKVGIDLNKHIELIRTSGEVLVDAEEK